MTRSACCGLILVGLLATALPASAKILKTRMKSPQSRFLALTIGSGVEYESDSEQSELGLPFLLDYGVTNALTLTVEPIHTTIRPKVGKTLNGFGDLETSATYGLVSERRHRPAVAAIALVKWPTATHAEFGTGQRDYELGVLASKALVQMDLDFSATYTLTGSPPSGSLPNTFTVSLAAERDLGSRMDLLAEIVSGTSGSSGAPTPGESEFEGTLGLAEQLTERLNLEQGVTVKKDGTWQIVFGWEWDFGDVR